MPPQAPTTGGVERPATPEEIIAAYAKKYKVAPALALAVANREARDPKTGKLNINAVGDEGRAIGLFQLHPAAAKDGGITPEQRYDPIKNIEAGVQYLKVLEERYNGDVQKMLMAYNGGMDNVDKGTVSPQAQAYAAMAIAEMSRGLRETATASSAPSLPAAATAGMLPQSTFAGDPAEPAPRAAAPGPISRFVGPLVQKGVVEPLTGIASMASSLVTEGPAATGKQFASAVVDPVVGGLEAASAARREGRPLDWVKEIVGAIPFYGPVIREAHELGASGDIAGGLGTLAGGLVPIRGIKRTTPAAVRQPIAEMATASAQKSMTKLFMAAGDGSKAAERAIQQIVPLALDQSLMRVTRGRWARAVEEAKTGIGREVGRTVNSPLGDEVVSIGPVLTALDSLRTEVTNFVPIGSTGRPVGVGARNATGLKAVAYNQRLVDQIETLEKILIEHGPTVHLRQLINVRRDWDEFVYASKSWLNREDMIKQYEARAKVAATDAVRGIIDKDPRFISLADLDRSYHLHSQLYSFIADESFGRGHGVPYYPGFGLQSAITRRLFDAAIKSPTWRLMSIATKKRLGDAMASNNVTATRNILRAVLGGGTAAAGRDNEDDLVQRRQDEQLILQSAATPAVQ